MVGKYFEANEEGPALLIGVGWRRFAHCLVVRT